MSADEGRCGLAAIVGRPNVGKSTLLNALVGEKISIVTAKPHTTRHRIVGVLNKGSEQAVFIDTPGHARRAKRTLHRLMARAVRQAVEDCDVPIVVIEGRGLTAGDRAVLGLLGRKVERALLVLNKIDLLGTKLHLLPVLREASEYPFAALIPVSAKTGENLERLTRELFAGLPAGPALFPLNLATDRSLVFRAAELIREKLMVLLREEVPYGLTVEVEHIGRNEAGQWLVHGLIWVERESQKGIVIGKEGHLLKQAGSAARLELCELLGGGVHLELWVKVREHWSDSDRELQRLGFDS